VNDPGGSTKLDGRSVPAELRQDYADEIRRRTGRSVLILALICVVIWPGSAWLDFMTWWGEPFLGKLLKIRFAYAGVFAACYAALLVMDRKGLLERFAYPAAAGLLAVAWTYVTWVAMIAGGIEEPYFGGVILILLTVLCVLPWRPAAMLPFCLLIFLSFDVVALLFDPDPSIDWRGFGIANYFYISTTFIGMVWIFAAERTRRQAFVQQRVIEEAKARSEGLLLNILPEEVAEELKAKGQVDARHIEDCTILFTDFVGFTEIAGQVAPAALLRSLDAAFSRFDAVVTRWELEKLKTIGDAYMCAGGVLHGQPDHLLRCVLASLEMLHVLEEEADLVTPMGERWQMRIGLHSGPVVAGVIGQMKFAYDLWGHTVNTAARLETAGEHGSLNVATDIYSKVEPLFVAEHRGLVEVRGIASIEMTRLLRIRPEYSADPEGRLPNSRFWMVAAELGAPLVPRPSSP
jgi:class 3 adenylate cyclase